MNDVLKSLTIEERGGGKISGLRYDSMDPLSHKLAEFPVPDRRRAAAQRHAGPAQGRAPGIEVRQRDGGRRHRQRPPGGRQRQAAGARAAHPDAGWRRAADPGPERGHRHSLHRPAVAAAVPRLPGGAGRGALQGQAQRVHRFHRRQGARGGGQLHDPGAGVEVELPADFRRQRAAGAGGLGHCGQHHRRGLDQGAALAGLGPADFVREPALCAEVRGAAHGGAGGRPRGEAGGA